MIVSVYDRDTEAVWKRLRSKKFGSIQGRAEERLAQIDAATSLKDFSFPSYED